MNEFMKTVLSLSASGALLLLLILGLKPLYKNSFSRRWQYYIWVIAALRFLLPFTPGTMLVGSLFDKPDTAAADIMPAGSKAPLPANTDSNDTEPVQTDRETARGGMRAPAEFYDCLFFIWAAPALVLLVRKITVYQDFIRYIKAGNTAVSDIKTLNLLSDCEEKLHLKTRAELSRNPLIASPVMIGFLHPGIILPSRSLDDKELSYIFMHELTHYRQKDMFYKWLIQLVVCVHWFNPLVYLLERQVNNCCELSCDEKVISMLDGSARREYGDMLLSFLKSHSPYKSSLASLTLTEEAAHLKERLGAIMNFKSKTKAIRVLTGALTLCIVSTAAFIGGSHMADASVPAEAEGEESGTSSADTGGTLPAAADAPIMETLEFRGTTYYLVFNEAQLRAIGTGAYGMDQNYMQQADIQLSANEWIPVGTWDNPFTGTYNGNGFEISGLTMTDPDAELVGLFGVAGSNAQIYNITLRDFDTTSAGRNAAKKSVGAIVAVAYGGRAYDNTVLPGETDTDRDD